ncbi:flagellar protein FlaG [Zobellella iuensis]|uniref:Flagellar protein FlaG n=1 Tax=Zobellella iuensis TaxID=2803811 RepID=A0ABS1QWB2_9GAMM|nr:flagellar protein FlaG [Zobellella iuensis]MBL1378408.1 flagellar protein FlaG [Zobellella iuensis]
MNTPPLSPKAPVSVSELMTRPSSVVARPTGSEATQTAQAVQAMDKTAATQPTPGIAQDATAFSIEQLEEMAGQMESFIGTFNRGLQFRVDENSGRQVVTVLDSDTGDVVRQIPTEELLDVITRLTEASRGLLDTKA